MRDGESVMLVGWNLGVWSLISVSWGEGKGYVFRGGFGFWRRDGG